jgi:hypothetical protein
MTEVETVVIEAADGQSVAELAQALLAVASDPVVVVWRPRAGGFEVPESVAQAYAATLTDDDSSAADEPKTPALATPKKATRRSRKNEQPKAEGDGNG